MRSKNELASADAPAPTTENTPDAIQRTPDKTIPTSQPKKELLDAPPQMSQKAAPPIQDDPGSVAEESEFIQRAPDTTSVISQPIQSETAVSNPIHQIGCTRDLPDRS